MTSDTRDPIVVEWPFDMRILSQRAAEQGRRVVTRFAMTREFNPLLSLQILDVLLIEGFAKCVSMRRLPPLGVRVRVANAAALGRDKHLSRNKRAGCSSCIAGRERIGTEFEIVRPGYLSSIGILVVVSVGVCRNLRASHQYQ